MINEALLKLRKLLIAKHLHASMFIVPRWAVLASTAALG